MMVLHMLNLILSERRIYNFLPEMEYKREYIQIRKLIYFIFRIFCIFYTIRSRDFLSLFFAQGLDLIKRFFQILYSF